jgi:outer membrane receptor protein involved in Fe transport
MLYSAPNPEKKLLIKGEIMSVNIQPTRTALSVAITAALLGAASHQASAEIEEVTVTATKRPESLQDVPIAVSALTEDSLDQLGIANFGDYLLELPGVTAGGSGPGQNTIYIRGVASTTPNLTTAGVAGLAPNVAFYLDEQPLAQPGRNLDVYAADLARVETLSGPQGTLFGASSQAGTVRLITNKPDPSDTYGSVKFGISFTEDGEMSNNVTGMINVPVSDNFALRGVVYVDNAGGYIDNVAGTRDASQSARFREAGTVRLNGEPVSVTRSGVQSASGVAAALAAGDTLVGERITDFSNVTFIEANNSGLVEDDINETTYAGGRLSALWDINDDWSLLVAHSRQDIDSEGVFFADPSLGDLEVQRFNDDTIEDKFHNTNWTLTAHLGELEVLYTGAFTDRETNQTVDYTDYLFVGQYLPYYICDATVTYPEYNNYYTAAGFTDGLPQGTCYAPNLFVKGETNTEVWTHEIRLTTDPGRRWRVTAGAFYSDLELEERNDFTYPGSLNAEIFPAFGGPPLGFAANFPQTTGFTSDPGPFPLDAIFRNDVQRTDEQFGVFGELTFDMSDYFSVTLGARFYDIEVDFEGSANASFCNGSNDPDVNRFGTDITDLYNGDGQFTFIGDCGSGGGITFTQGQTFDEIKAILTAADSFSIGRGQFVNAPNAISDAEIQGIVNSLNAPDSASTDGTIFKVTGTWTPNADQLYYATWSESFRPGLLNRPGGAVGTNGFTVPFGLDTDDVTNLEIGWKSSYLDNTLRFNGSLFFLDIEKLQTTIFDPSISNLFFSDNAADAEIKGLEGDLVWQPEFTVGLTVSAAFSILDSEITAVLTPTNDVRLGDELAFAPEFQGNIRARYEWELQNSNLLAHVMPSVIFSSESFSDIITINRAEIDSWVMANLTLGVTSDDWGAELFIDNLTDERAEISRNFVFDRNSVTYVRPLTVGVRVSYDF